MNMQYRSMRLYLSLYLLGHVLVLVDPSRKTSCSTQPVCPIQPPVILAAVERIVTDLEKHEATVQYPVFDSAFCVFEKLDGACDVESFVQVHQMDAVPASQGWAICEHCGLDSETRQFFVYQSANNTREEQQQVNTDFIDLSWSLWGEFFLAQKNDQYRALIGIPKTQLILYLTDSIPHVLTYIS